MNDDAKKAPRIGVKVRKALDALAAGRAKNISDAATQASMSREHLSRELRRPHIALALEARTRELLSTGMLRAGVKLLELVDGPSSRVAFEAAKHTLAIANVRPPEQSSPLVSVNVSPGYVISAFDPRTHTFDGQPLPEGDERRAVLIERGLIDAPPALPTPVGEDR